MTLTAQSLDVVDTDYSACSVSACPSNRSIIACGLYQIVADETAEINKDSPATKRLGRCLLTKVDEKGKLCGIPLASPGEI